MAKCAKLYEGNDSYGRLIQCAISENGFWFSREYAFNGYAKAWSKWREMTEAPSLIENNERLEWGFSYLRHFGTGGCRLPK